VCLSPVLAASSDYEDVAELFGDPQEGEGAQGPNSRTSSKKRCAFSPLPSHACLQSFCSHLPFLSPLLSAEEFRKLGRDLVTLPPKTLNRMSLPSDLMEAIQEVRLLLPFDTHHELC